MNKFDYRYIFGKRVFAVDSISHLITCLGNYKGILIAMNAIKLMNEDEDLTFIINNNFSYSDGVGSVKALHKSGLNTIRVPGVELWIRLINKYYKQKSIYLIGSTEVNILKAVNKLKHNYPDLNLCGFHHGYFNEDVEKKIIENIIKTKPDFVFVALGSPRQEYFMNHLLKYHKALYMGLGGSIDVYIGAVKRAPKLWIKFNLEWAYRLVKQPKRIFRQWVYFKFLYRLITNKI